jgi:hypothetical protein
VIRIKSRNEAATLGAFIFPRWVPFAGLVSGVLLLVVDLIVKRSARLASEPILS